MTGLGARHRAGHQVHQGRLDRRRRDAADLPADEGHPRALRAGAHGDHDAPATCRRRCRHGSTCSCSSSKIHKPTLRALAYARASRPTVLEAITVDVDHDDTVRLQEEWERIGIPVTLKILASPYREITRPILDYVKDLRTRQPERPRHRVHPRVRRRALVGAAPPQPVRAAPEEPPALHPGSDGDERALAAAVQRRRRRQGRGPGCPARLTRANASGGPEGLAVGDERVVDIGPIAHGGHFIAHSDGRTLFVRHAITGERVRVRVTDVNRKMVRADAIEVLDASPDRVPAPVPLGPRRRLRRLRLPARRRPGAAAPQAGGADATPCAGSAASTTQALARLDLTVNELPGHPDGLHWRTRMTWATDAEGHVGLRRHRSHDVIPVDRLPDRGRGRGRARAGAHRQGRPTRSATAPGAWSAATSGRSTTPCPRPSSTPSSSSASPQPGQAWWDLYAGAGLFAAFLGEAVGTDGTVDSIEEAAAGGQGRPPRPARPAPGATSTRATCAPGWPPPPAPRRRRPRPAPGRCGGVRALGRLRARPPTDRLRRLRPRGARPRRGRSSRGCGYRLDALRAFDAFPMTHHLEAQSPNSPLTDHAEDTDRS